MKIKVKLLTAMLGLSSLAFGQQQVFNLSTGVSNGTLITPGTNDGKWVVRTPASGGVFIPVKAVYTLLPWWAGDEPNSRWISPYSDGTNYPIGGAVGEYTYQTTITVPSCVKVTSSQIVFNKIGADDGLISVSVNGNVYALSGSYSPLSTTSVTVTGLTEGLNTIQIRLQNSQSYTGLLVNGQLTVNYQPIYAESSYANGWSKDWTNNASGMIEAWGLIQPSDKFIPFDTDGDGSEELLCIEAVNSNPPGVAAKIKIIDYYTSDQSWHPFWTNNNNGSFNKNSFSGWGVRALDKYIVGDFDGDGKKSEILCIQGDGTYAAILKFNMTTLNFDMPWINPGNSKLSKTSSGWSFSANDKFVVGDFNNDGKNNDVFCVQGNTSGNCWGISTFNGSDFNSLAYACGSIQSGSNIVWSTIGRYDEFRAGDFDGDVKTQEILCTERSVGNNAAIIKYNNGWTPVWSNGGNGSIGGWGPLGSTDKVLVGYLDTDSPEEFMFIQRCSNCGWATTENLRLSDNQPEWHWSNHNYTGNQQNYIDDWKVNDVPATNVDYLLIKVSQDSPKYLLAFKKYACSNFLVSLYKPQLQGINFRTNPDDGKATTGIRTAAEQEAGFNLYPNPNAGSFTVSFLNSVHRKISIYNTLGAVVYETETTGETLTIDLASKDKGVYVMRVVEQDQTKMKRIIVQ
jgi:hypothetical protein